MVSVFWQEVLAQFNQCAQMVIMILLIASDESIFLVDWKIVGFRFESPESVGSLKWDWFYDLKRVCTAASFDMRKNCKAMTRNTIRSLLTN